MLRYLAIVHRTPAKTYSASIPDCPGCVATAATFVEVELLAAEMLQRHLDKLEALGIAPPRASDIAEVRRDPASQGGVIIAVRDQPAAAGLKGRAGAARRAGKAAPPAA
jgi:predicted RNase H-like HicB family nuclease